MTNQEFEFTRQDMIRGSLLAFRRRLFSKSWLALQIVAILFLTLAITLYNEGRDWTVWTWLAAILIMCGFLVVAHLLMVVFSVFWGAQMLAWHPHLRQKFMLQIREDGVRLTSDKGDWIYSWFDFTDMTEGRDIFVLMLGPSMFLPIPKRILDRYEIAIIRKNAPSR